MYRKFLTEFGLNVYTSYKAILPLERVYDYSDDHQYNIYIVTCTPRIYIVEDSISPKGDTISIEFKYEHNGKTETHVVNGMNILPCINHEKVKWEILKNGEFLRLTAEEKLIRELYEKADAQVDPKIFVNGKFTVTIEAGELWVKHCYKEQKCINYDVLYIGQAYGKEGNRCAQDRLKSHSKLQSILTDFYTSRRDDRLYVFLFELDILNQISIDGLNKNSTASSENEGEHFNNIMNHEHRFNQIVNIFEAALINYFKPPYNVNFINNFPDKKK